MQHEKADAYPGEYLRHYGLRRRPQYQIGRAERTGNITTSKASNGMDGRAVLVTLYQHLFSNITTDGLLTVERAYRSCR